MLVGYERVFWLNSFSVGIKAGYAFERCTRELLTGARRGARRLLAADWRRASIFASGRAPVHRARRGGRSIDSSVKVTQHEDTKVFELLAWRKGGPGFAALGAGISYAINPATAVFAEVKATQLFGSTGTGASLGIRRARPLARSTELSGTTIERRSTEHLSIGTACWLTS